MRTSVTPALGREAETKAIFGYIVSSRTTRGTRCPGSKTNKQANVSRLKENSDNVPEIYKGVKLLKKYICMSTTKFESTR